MKPTTELPDIVNWNLEHIGVDYQIRQHSTARSLGCLRRMETFVGEHSSFPGTCSDKVSTDRSSDVHEKRNAVTVIFACKQSSQLTTSRTVVHQ